PEKSCRRVDDKPYYAVQVRRTEGRLRGVARRPPNQGTADWETRAMSTYKRRERRFQVESLECRLAPGGAPGGVLINGVTRSIGEEIPQVHVAPLAMGGASGGVIHAVRGVGEEIPQRA